MALLSSFMANEKESRQIEELSHQELDSYLSRFLLSVRKRTGKNTSLRPCVVSLHHLSVISKNAAIGNLLSMALYPRQNSSFTILHADRNLQPKSCVRYSSFTFLHSSLTVL